MTVNMVTLDSVTALFGYEKRVDAVTTVDSFRQADAFILPAAS
jgi:hypothetical protein